MPHVNGECKCVDGYHGTSSKASEDIIENNFCESQGQDQWLGAGVYFFLEGFSDSPSDDARNWAIAHAWDKQNRCYKYSHYSVLSCKIRLCDLWDLTSDEGLKIFNYSRKKILQKIRNRGMFPYGKNFDSTVIEYVKKNMGFQSVKANFYVKFTFERLKKIDSRVPNTTILAVCDPASNIKKETIRIVSKGVIKK